VAPDEEARLSESGCGTRRDATGKNHPAKPGADLYQLASGWELFGNYDSQVNAQQVFHVGSGGLQVAW
jgi:hypothetical protein